MEGLSTPAFSMICFSKQFCFWEFILSTQQGKHCKVEWGLETAGPSSTGPPSDWARYMSCLGTWAQDPLQSWEAEISLALVFEEGWFLLCRWNS